jgi:hypothetical protein
LLAASSRNETAPVDDLLYWLKREVFSWSAGPGSKYLAVAYPIGRPGLMRPDRPREPLTLTFFHSESGIAEFDPTTLEQT